MFPRFERSQSKPATTMLSTGRSSRQHGKYLNLEVLSNLSDLKKEDEISYVTGLPSSLLVYLISNTFFFSDSKSSTVLLSVFDRDIAQDSRG